MGVLGQLADFQIGHATRPFWGVLRLCAVGWRALPTMADVINPWLNSGKTRAKMGSGCKSAASSQAPSRSLGFDGILANFPNLGIPPKHHQRSFCLSLRFLRFHPASNRPAQHPCACGVNSLSPGSSSRSHPTPLRLWGEPLRSVVLWEFGDKKAVQPGNRRAAFCCLWADLGLKNVLLSP